LNKRFALFGAHQPNVNFYRSLRIESILTGLLCWFPELTYKFSFWGSSPLRFEIVLYVYRVCPQYKGFYPKYLSLPKF